MLGNHFGFLTPDNRRRPLALRSFASFNQKPTKMIFQASKVGCPIRRSMDQSLFAAPHGFSQRITSFIACACQGIHQMPFFHLIVLIANAHLYLGLAKLSYSACRLAGQPNLAIRTPFSIPHSQPKNPVTFYNRANQMPSTCSTGLLYWNHAERFTCSLSLRPASRDLSGDARSGNTNQTRTPDGHPEGHPNNIHAFNDKLPSYLQPLRHFRSARPSMVSSGLGSDVSGNLSITFNTWKLPDISSLHNFCRTGIRLIKTMQNLLSPRIITASSTPIEWWS